MLIANRAFVVYQINKKDQIQKYVGLPNLQHFSYGESQVFRCLSQTKFQRTGGHVFFSKKFD